MQREERRSCDEGAKTRGVRFCRVSRRLTKLDPGSSIQVDGSLAAKLPPPSLPEPKPPMVDVTTFVQAEMAAAQQSSSSTDMREKEEKRMKNWLSRN